MGRLGFGVAATEIRGFGIGRDGYEGGKSACKLAHQVSPEVTRSFGKVGSQSGGTG